MLELVFYNGMGTVALGQDRLSVGRDAGNDIVLDDGRVSGFHANIIKNVDKFEIVDLGSSNGTFVNGEFLKGRRVLKAWDKIIIGEITIEVVDSDGRRPTMVQPVVDGAAMGAGAGAPGDGGPFLKLVSPGSYAVQVPVVGSLSIGRSQANALRLDAPTVSSSHAEIRMSGGQYELVDRGSTNGTFVNGRKVSQAILNHGDKVAFDQVEYLFQAPGADSAKTMVNPALHQAPASTVVSPSISSSASALAATATGPSPAMASPKIRPVSEFLGDAPAPAQASVTPPAAAVRPPAQASVQSAVQQPAAPKGAPCLSHQGVKWLYFSTEGRIPRKTYFLGILGMMAALVPVYLAMYAILGDRTYVPGTKENVINAVIVNVIGLYPMIALNAKRLHDLGRTGAWVWVFVASIAGGVLITVNQELLIVGGIAQLAGFVLGLYTLFFKGKEGPNQYGHPYQPSK